jgi:hypothetical protein
MNSITIFFVFLIPAKDALSLSNPTFQLNYKHQSQLSNSSTDSEVEDEYPFLSAEHDVNSKNDDGDHGLLSSDASKKFIYKNSLCFPLDVHFIAGSVTIHYESLRRILMK